MWERILEDFTRHPGFTLALVMGVALLVAWHITRSRPHRALLCPVVICPVCRDEPNEY